MLFLYLVQDYKNIFKSNSMLGKNVRECLDRPLLESCFVEWLPSVLAKVLIIVHFYFQSNIRHMLRLSGVSPLIYWMHFLVADGLVFLAPVLLCFILVGAFQIPSLSSAPALGCFALEVLVYLASGLLFTYTVSFLFNKWETAQSVTSQLYGFVSTL